MLDHPADWSQGDAFSPHGDDLGADILAAWARVKGQSVAELALGMAHVKKTGT